MGNNLLLSPNVACYFFLCSEYIFYFKMIYLLPSTSLKTIGKNTLYKSAFKENAWECSWVNNKCIFHPLMIVILNDLLNLWNFENSYLLFHILVLWCIFILMWKISVIVNVVFENRHLTVSWFYVWLKQTQSVSWNALDIVFSRSIKWRMDLSQAVAEDTHPLLK